MYNIDGKMFKMINDPNNQSRSCIKINDMYATFLMSIMELNRVIHYRHYVLVYLLMT